MASHHQILVVGGGSAGITVAARLRHQKNPPEVAIIEPSGEHYYQPIWTLVGAGVFPKETSQRWEGDYIPAGVTWIRDRATAFDPENNQVETSDSGTITYDYLIVCPGIQINWGALPGLVESIGKNGVCSNYAYDQVDYTWETLRNFKGGTAIFTTPATPIKCGGAPQKIMYLAADHLRRRGLLDQTDIHFMTPGSVLFGVPEFAKTLYKVVDRYGIDVHLQTELIEVRGEKKEAVFQTVGEDGGVEQYVKHFDMMHVTPPQGPPDFIKNSLLANEEGWVDVDKHTLQHHRYTNVFALGDAAGTPNAKTGAAVRKQAPTVVHNLMNALRREGMADPKTYNGYSSCPLVTGYGKLVLAEFDYDNRPDPSFPFDTTKERHSMYALKAYLLPKMYWHGMLRGRA